MVAKPHGEVSGYGESGWNCPGCGVRQLNGTPLYVVYTDTGAFSSFRCVECCRERGLIW